MNRPIKITFLDSDLAQLFSNIKETRITAVSCAVFVQTLDHLICRNQRGRKKKSLLITISELHKEWFPYLSYSMTKRILQRLRRIGVLKTRVICMRTKDNKHVEQKTRIWIQDKKILELAEQVKRERELGDMAKRLSSE